MPVVTGDAPILYLATEATPKLGVDHYQSANRNPLERISFRKLDRIDRRMPWQRCQVVS